MRQVAAITSSLLPFVVGLEGTINGANLEAQTRMRSTLLGPPEPDRFVRHRHRPVGYAVPGASNVLLYFKGGVVFADNRSKLRTAASRLHHRPPHRWTVGAGVEWAFAPNWSFFIQGDYYDLGKNATENFTNFSRLKTRLSLRRFRSTRIRPMRTSS